jgi:hypothetical protein
MRRALQQPDHQDKTERGAADGGEDERDVLCEV